MDDAKGISQRLVDAYVMEFLGESVLFTTRNLP
jgi:hypothetical protein